jgi:hypothetical protein
VIKVFSDYFRVNKAMWRRDFLRISLALLLILLGFAIRAPVTDQEAYSVPFIVERATILIIAAALFVGLIGTVDAWLKVSRLAREARMSIDRYVKSASYQLHGRESLRRTDKQRKWI